MTTQEQERQQLESALAEMFADKSVTRPPITMSDIEGATEAFRRVENLRIQAQGESNRLGWKILFSVGRHLQSTIENFGKEYFADSESKQ